jgi:hypothetical protein
MITCSRNVVLDLESFGRHAGQSTATTHDVLLLDRRNGDLHSIIKDFVHENNPQNKGKGEATKRTVGFPTRHGATDF